VEQGRFPEIRELKQLVRDRIAPGRSLGHSDAR
jgi:selenoprotein W-related protein